MRNNRLDEKVIGSAKVIVDILPKGYCVPNRKLQSIGYITIHNTGSTAPAKNQHNYMKNINKSGERQASWHFTVDDKEIYQAQSTNFELWHAGNSTGNKNSIGIEICQSNNKEIQGKIYKNAIELVKILMKYHNIPIDRVVQHNKWSGKSCPDYLRRSVHGYSWNWFIGECKKTVSNNNVTNETKPTFEQHKNCVLYGNDIDKVGAEIISWAKEDCIIKHIDKHIKWEGHNLFIVGGAAEKKMKELNNGEQYKIISGIDRYDTVRKCLELIGK